jgi:serine/threonine protein kinase
MGWTNAVHDSRAERLPVATRNLEEAARGSLARERFELLRPLGSGGMGTVWLARVGGLEGFRRLVALKRLHPRFVNDATVVGMLLKEASLSASIHHACVVSVEEVVVGGGQVALVMLYVPGCSLAQAMDAMSGGAVPLPVVAAVILDVLAGLQAAHEAVGADDLPLGIVHRDVSPQNVLVGRDGNARLLDFGVASSSGADGNAARSWRGKPAYMAPEQLEGGDVDCRADVFGLAATAWRMVTGKAPYGASRGPARLARIERGPTVRSRSSLTQGERTFLAALEPALHARPDRRPSSAAEFAELLRSVLPVATREEVAAWVRAVEAALPYRAAGGGSDDRTGGSISNEETQQSPPPEPFSALSRGTASRTTEEGVER